jgi:hypothetical protein
LQFLDQALAFGFRGRSLGDVANDHAGSGISLGALEHHGRELDGEKCAVFASGPELAVGSARSLPLRDQNCELGIGGIDQPLPSLLQNLFPRSAHDSAGSGIRVEDGTIRCSQHKTVKAVLE